MWPKMLFELLPHFARLVPMADRFFATRSASERAQEAALLTISETIRSDLGKVTAAHSGLASQLATQASLVSLAAEDAARARLATESAEARIARLEKTAATSFKLLTGTLVLLAAVFILLILLLLKR